MITGSFTLNGIDDQQLIEILKAKAKHENKITFFPNQMQSKSGNQNGKQVSWYDNVMLQFGSAEAFKAVIEVLTHLSHGDTQQP